MARVGSEGLRGKVGGVVYSESRNGVTVRALKKPRNPRTSAQQAIRQRTASISSQWRALTDEQREAWNRFGAAMGNVNGAGKSGGWSGQNAFVSMNQNLACVGAPIVLTPPPSGARVSRLSGGSGKLTVAGRDITGFTLDFRLAGGKTLKANEKIFVRATFPRSAGQGNAKLFTRQAAINRGRGYDSLTADASADYAARFGKRMDKMQVIGINAKIINTATGAASEYLQFRVAP